MKKICALFISLVLFMGVFSLGCGKSEYVEYKLTKIANIDIDIREDYDVIKDYSFKLNSKKSEYVLKLDKEYLGSYIVDGNKIKLDDRAADAKVVSAELNGNTIKIKLGSGLTSAYYTFVSEEGETPAHKKLSNATMIEDISFVSMITGLNAPRPTTEWDVGGTDLGFPFYNSKTDTMFFAFGDTFSNANRMGSWRSNVLANTKDFDASDGIEFDGFLTNASGGAKAFAEGHHADLYEHTKIPTGGIEIDGNLYIFYMSIREWDYWTVTYNGVVKSADNGETWERVYDLSWALTDTDTEIEDIYWNQTKPKLTKAELAADTLELMNQNIRRQHDPEANVTLEGRIAPNFGQIFPIDGKDGYIYIAGITGNRTGATKLGRVTKENFETFNAYEYFTGFDSTGKPVYVKGARGLEMIRNSDDANIIPKSNAEQCYMYNEYLGKWTMFEGNNFRTAERLEGPWSAKQVIVTWEDYFDDIPKEWCINHDASDINDRTLIPYGGQVHEKYTEQEGKIVYYNLSAWGPYNSILLQMEFK